MKGRQRIVYAVLSLFTAGVMSACSGGGGGGPAGGGSTTQGAAVSKGVITALGSVIVNGVEFSTTGATVKVDDNPSTADQLKVGMVVKVRGNSNDDTKTGTATQIEANDALEGTISAVGANTITVMGQTVQVEDNVTRLNDDNNLKTFAAAAFAVGDVVEVHGFAADDNGGLRATRVAKKAAGTGEFEIKGFVRTSAAGSFTMSQTANSTAILTVTSSGTIPAVGAFVEVKAAAAPSGGAITATSVKVEDALGANGEKVEVEGIVTTGNVDSFVINGQPVTTSSTTVFEGGLKTDFAAGIKVEAEGPLNASGVIVATKISFRSNIRLEGDVTALSAGSLTVLGKTVAINSFTRTDNGPVASGSHVEVRANPDRDGNLIATRIVVRNPDTRAFLQGPVTVTSGAMSILGSPITTSASTEFRISSDSTDAAVTSAVFFAQLKNNVTVVKVRWRPFSSLTAPVEQAEIQLGKTLLSSNDSSSKGVVTAKGSVFVNGVEFHTGGAAVMINGVPSTEDKLQIGMVVKVRGTADDATKTGTATLVEANDALEGTITAVGANTITVMGQTVRIEDNVTRLNDDAANPVKTFAAAGFAVGERVEVHGLIDDLGGLRATRAVKKAEGEFQVKGFVVATGNPFGLSLTPGGTASISVSGSLPAGVIVGSIVEVKASAAPASGVLTATSVQLEDEIGAAGEKVEAEGIVMAGGTVDSFTIDGQKVATSASTLFEGGLKADFAVGSKVSAQGPLDANGAINATKVSFRSNIKIEADASLVSATSLTVLGQTVAINAFTRMDAGIVDGSQVEVRAFLDRDGKLVATRVVSRTQDTRAFFQGPVSAFDSAAGTMTILGVPISTTGASFRVSVDSTDTPVPAATFFGQLKNNVTVVKVRWDTFANTAAAVNQAEIQLGK